MSISQLIPWNRERASTAMTTREPRDSLLALHREMSRLFDDMWRRFEVGGFEGGDVFESWPRLELNETGKDYVLSAELPGMTEKDVEVLFDGQCVVLRGERRAERNEEGQNRRLSERFYGRFERRIPLDLPIEPEKAKAEFRNGVLTVTLPKAAQAQTETVRIPIAKAA